MILSCIFKVSLLWSTASSTNYIKKKEWNHIADVCVIDRLGPMITCIVIIAL